MIRSSSISSMLAPDTIAEGATLHFKRIKTRFRCRSVDTSLSLRSATGSARSVRLWGGDVVAGKEFYVESIEVRYAYSTLGRTLIVQRSLKGA